MDLGGDDTSCDLNDAIGSDYAHTGTRAIRGGEIQVSQSMASHDTASLWNPTTLRDTTAVLSTMADVVDELVRFGVQPPVPEALVLAAARIADRMRVYRPTTQIPLTQLVISLAAPGKDVTAKELFTQLTQCGWETTNQAISVVLHRAAVRGIFERRQRGVYRLVPTESRPEETRPQVQAEKPSVSRRKQERKDANATTTRTEQETPLYPSRGTRRSLCDGGAGSRVLPGGPAA